MTATVVQTELARSVRRIRSIFYVLTEKTVILFCLLTGEQFCVFLCQKMRFPLIFHDFFVSFQHFLWSILTSLSYENENSLQCQFLKSCSNWRNFLKKRISFFKIIACVTKALKRSLPYYIDRSRTNQKSVFSCIDRLLLQPVNNVE